MLRFVGLPEGARVLDAGAGSGGYLPLLSENVALAEDRRASGKLPRVAEARERGATPRCLPR